MKVLFVSGLLLQRKWIRDLLPTKKLEELKEFAEVETADSSDKQAIIYKARDADVILSAGKASIDAEIINSADNLKMIQTTSVGFDHVDSSASLENGVIICNVGESCANSVAELCFGLILDLARRISAHDRLMRDGGWERLEPERQFVIRYKTLGIVGLGAIGTRMAQIGKYGFDMNVIATDPYITGDKAGLYGAELVDLPTLMKESDVVTVHVPLSASTRHLIGERELRLMKPSAIIVNSSRGPVVDEEALIRVLVEKRIGGAGLDVFETEPLPKESPLRRLENVVIAPHIGSTSGTVKHMFEVAFDNVIRVASGKQPMNIQTPKTYYSSLKWEK